MDYHRALVEVSDAEERDNDLTSILSYLVPLSDGDAVVPGRLTPGQRTYVDKTLAQARDFLRSSVKGSPIPRPARRFSEGVSQVWMPRERSALSSEQFHTRSTLVKHLRLLSQIPRDACPRSPRPPLLPIAPLPLLGAIRPAIELRIDLPCIFTTKTKMTGNVL